MINFKTDIVRRFLSGETIAQIAESEGCSYDTVKEYLNIKELDSECFKFKSDVVSRYLSGEIMKDIAKDEGCEYEILRWAIRKTGIPKLIRKEITNFKCIKGKNYKRCSKCKRLLRANNFRKDSQKKNLLSVICKECRSELYDKKRYKNGLEKLKNNPLDLTPTGTLTTNGYRMVYFKEGITIPEHRWVMMKFLKRPLEKWEYVHHKNKNRSDNRLENLELTPQQHEHEVGMHQKASITTLQKENEELKKRIKELESK